ncbi:MAG: glutathione S-transferase N-terminal domain-containing protein [Alphaproteobacteria bacterium]|nr:glutathione S-transferase N-terminal domain-containing protein [Alphaproteobacteria bacterium]
MIRFYFNPGPNPMKVALLLEETGLEYEVIPVDPARGEQFSPTFTAINPNNKLPALVDGDAVVFDSNAILLYLAEKSCQFLSADTPADRAQLLSWLMFVATGVGPYCGQAVHFRHFAPEPKDYALGRYTFEAHRHYKILDTHLADREWMIGDCYTIVDMAVWGWGRSVATSLGEEAAQEFTHLHRHVAKISERPAAIRAMALREQYSFNAFDEEGRRHLFRHVQPAARTQHVQSATKRTA